MGILKTCEDSQESFDPWFESSTTQGAIFLANKPDVYYYFGVTKAGL